MSTGNSENKITLTFTDSELEMINQFHKNYVLTTGDISFRRALMMKKILLKIINEPKALQMVARLQRIKRKIE